MDKKITSLLICSIIVFVSSNPVDRADYGGKQTGGSNFSYTEPPKSIGPIVNTLASVTSQQIVETPANKSKVPPVATNVTNGSTIVPSSVRSTPANDTNPSDPTADTTTKQTETTTVLPSTNATTAPTTTVTTTISTPTTTVAPTTTTAPPTTTTVTPETTKIPTTSTPPATTTAAAATTTDGAPTASPSKDRRFDGPSFIGGIVLSLGIMAIGFVAFKFYKARTERNYHTL